MQVFVEDLVLAVGQFLETGKGRVQGLVAIELDTEFLQAALEGIAPGMLAQNQFVLKLAKCRTPR